MNQPSREHFQPTQRRKVYFDIELVPSERNPTEFRLVREPGAPQEPLEMADLRREYFKVVEIILTVFQDDESTRREMVTRAAEYAKIGLVGDDYDLSLAKENLDSIKKELEDKAYRMRSEWLKKYTYLALYAIFIPTVLAGIVILYAADHSMYFGQRDVAGSPSTVSLLIAAFWIPAGAAFGVWIEFALRTGNQMKYESLLEMDPDRWRPGQRILITIAVAYAFAFVLGIKVVQVGLGTVLLNDFVDKRPEAALAIGGVAGLAFPFVRDILSRLRPETRDVRNSLRQ
jgi:hypothetical protein